MKKEFIVSVKGKEMVLYAGLLDLAHSTGLVSITTQLIQVPNDSNGGVAICFATVTMSDGKVFTGIGDASKSNVAPMVQSAIIRMAETRAKARAIRDAVNIGMCSFEELGEDEPPASVASVAKPLGRGHFIKAAEEAGMFLLGTGLATNDLKPVKEMFAKQIKAAFAYLSLPYTDTPTSEQVGTAISRIPTLIKDRLKWDENHLGQKKFQAEDITPPGVQQALRKITGISGEIKLFNLTASACSALEEEFISNERDAE